MKFLKFICFWGFLSTAVEAAGNPSPDVTLALPSDLATSIMRLPEKEHQELQTYFLRIHQMFFPNESAKDIPQVFLANLSGAYALAVRTTPPIVLWNYRFFQTADSEDVERFTWLHELRHFRQRVENPGEGKISREADADYFALHHLFQVGKRSAEGVNHPALVNPQAIIEWAQTRGAFISHLSDQDLENSVKGFIANEIGNRPTPNESTPRKQRSHELMLATAQGFKLPAYKAESESALEASLQEADRLRSLLTKDPLGVLAARLPEIKRWMTIKTPTEFELEQLQDVATEVANLMTALNGEIPDNAKSQFFDRIRGAPKDLFRTLNAFREFLPSSHNGAPLPFARIFEPSRFLMISIAQYEEFFENWSQPSKWNSLPTFGSTLEYPLSWLEWAFLFSRSDYHLLEPILKEAPQEAISFLSVLMVYHNTPLGNLNAIDLFVKYCLHNPTLIKEAFSLGHLSEEALEAVIQSNQLRPLDRLALGNLLDELNLPKLSALNMKAIPPEEAADFYLAHRGDPKLLPHFLVLAPSLSVATRTEATIDSELSEALKKLRESLWNFTYEEKTVDLLSLINALKNTELTEQTPNELWPLIRAAKSGEAIHPIAVMAGVSRALVIHSELNKTALGLAFAQILKKLNVNNRELALQTDLAVKLQGLEWISAVDLTIPNLTKTRAEFGRLIAELLPFLEGELLSQAALTFERIQGGDPTDKIQRASLHSAYLRFDWNHLFENLGPATFATHAVFNHPEPYKREHSILMLKRNKAVIQRLIRELKAETYSPQESVQLVTAAIQGSPIWNPENQKLLDSIRTNLMESEAEIFKSLSGLSPHLFNSPTSYIDFVVDVLSAQIKRQSRSFREKEFGALHRYVTELKNRFPNTDALLKQAILDRLAGRFKVLPDAKQDFTIKTNLDTPQVDHFAHQAHILLHAFRQLSWHDRWYLVQWLRGRDKKSHYLVFQNIERSLNDAGYFFGGPHLERYLRERFNELSPLGRGLLFLTLLTGGKDNLLNHPGIQKDIRSEIFGAFSGPSREVAEELFDAAKAALPSALHEILLTMALAESGGAGTPEEALRLVFLRMGPLVQKNFAQNLVYDPHLPPSYRKALEKVWDDVQEPTWWEAMQLLKEQYGDFWDAPSDDHWHLERIRNSGTTEIYLELSRPGRKNIILPVFVDQLEHKADLDYKHMKAFTAHLRAGPHRDRYAFMPLLVEDSYRTFKLEADRKRKQQMNDEMGGAYEKAVLSLGGSKQGEELQYKGWTIARAKYGQDKLPNGESFVYQSIAPGIPLRKLSESDPTLYPEISKLILDIEDAAQADSTLPIDKDRSPGQYMVDVATRTITFLDPGQAKHVMIETLERRDQFLGAVYGEINSKLQSILKEVGFSSVPGKVLSNILKVSENGMKPLAVLGEVYSLAPEQVKDSEAFWDLVHSVRAKLRLAHWAESIGDQRYHEQFRKLAKAEMGLRALVNACLRFGGRKP